tara:strand:- start:28 stop:1107 length:1080 start_codon:yes stop_codon:yes gene_type:complete
MLDNSILISILGFLIILTPLVFIHELGHYLIAIKNNVKVDIFSVGFGKEIFGFNDKNGTRWKFCILPFGGYVKMKGELLVDEKNEHINDKSLGNFNQASLISRFFIVFSGPLANIFFGVLLISLLYSLNGRLDSKPVVGEVIKGSSAFISGVAKNDIILKVNEENINNFYELRDIVQLNANNQLELTIQRSSEILNLKITPSPFYDKKSNKTVGRIGILSGKPKLVKLNLFSSIYYSIIDTYTLTIQWVKGLWTLITLQANKNDVAGPIGIAKISGDALTNGFFSIIFLMALLSINLGLINLLPIPGLDGGYISLYFIEFLFGKPLPKSLQLKLMQFGIFFLISLMIFITLWDIKKWFV